MNPILLQKQIRDNATDLQDFCKDLKSWGETMKRKEESLKKSDSEKATPSNKVRKILKSEKKTTRKPTKCQKPATRIGATDYAAWEKFDADAECEKLQDDINDESELTDECNENLQDEAIVEKEKGNKFVQKQNWDEAIKCYTRAIECYSYDPIFYANRALCYLKKGNFQEAEKDCTLSLKLDNTYVKAYQRRAAAREGLKKFQDAEYDILRALELEPKNKECRMSLEKVRKQLGKVEKPPEQRPVSKFTASRNKSDATNKPYSTPLISSPKPDHQITKTEHVIDTSLPVPSWPKQDDIILVKAINKPPHLRSQKPLKRIDIIEKDGSKIENEKNETTRSVEPEAIKKHVLEKKEVQEVIEEPTKPVSAFKKRQLEKNLEKTEHTTALPRPGQQTVCLKSDDFRVIEKKNSENPIDKLLNVSKEVKNSSNKDISSSGNQNLIDDNETNTKFIVPKTSVQFYLTWKNLKDTEDKYRYLKIIPPEDFPKMFMDSLESNIFSNILEVLVKHFIENRDCVFNILDKFTQVKRFGTFTMFMTTSDKNNLWKLFDYIKEIEQINKEDVDQLINKYEM